MIPSPVEAPSHQQEITRRLKPFSHTPSDIRCLQRPRPLQCANRQPGGRNPSRGSRKPRPSLKALAFPLARGEHPHEAHSERVLRAGSIQQPSDTFCAGLPGAARKRQQCQRRSLGNAPVHLGIGRPSIIGAPRLPQPPGRRLDGSRVAFRFCIQCQQRKRGGFRPRHAAIAPASIGMLALRYPGRSRFRQNSLRFRRRIRYATSSTSPTTQSAINPSEFVKKLMIFSSFLNNYRT